MRIQRFQHAANGPMDKIVRLNFFDVMFLDLGQDFRENFEFFVGFTGMACFSTPFPSINPRTSAPNTTSPETHVIEERSFSIATS